MIAVTYKGYFSSNIKSERNMINRNLSNLLNKKGRMLEPISYAAVKHFMSYDRRHEIYKVSGLNTGVAKVLNKHFDKVTYFAGYHPNSNLGNRIRKLALIDFNDGDTYLFIQDTLNFSTRISLINVKTYERKIFKSVNNAAAYLLALKESLSELPLILNTNYKEAKEVVLKRLSKSEG